MALPRLLALSPLLLLAACGAGSSGAAGAGAASSSSSSSSSSGGASSSSSSSSSSGGASSGASVNPFAGARLYVDPAHEALATIQAWEAAGRHDDAVQLQKIAQSPRSPRFFAEWTEAPGNGGVAFYVDY